MTDFLRQIVVLVRGIRGMKRNGGKYKTVTTDFAVVVVERAV